MVDVKQYKRRVYATHSITSGFPEDDLILVAPRYRQQEETEGNIFALDALLGDDRYVFLSAESIYGASPEYHGRSNEDVDIFVFDAIALVRKGALVRKYDIAATEEWERYEELSSVSVWEPHPTEILLEDMEESPELKAAFRALKKKRDEITLSGQDAIEYLSHPNLWGKGRIPTPEILVPRQLDLSEAIGVDAGGT